MKNSRSLMQVSIVAITLFSHHAFATNTISACTKTLTPSDTGFGAVATNSVLGDKRVENNNAITDNIRKADNLISELMRSLDNSIVPTSEQLNEISAAIKSIDVNKFEITERIVNVLSSMAMFPRSQFSNEDLQDVAKRIVSSEKNKNNIFGFRQVLLEAHFRKIQPSGGYTNSWNLKSLENLAESQINLIGKEKVIESLLQERLGSYASKDEMLISHRRLLGELQQKVMTKMSPSSELIMRELVIRAETYQTETARENKSLYLIGERRAGVVKKWNELLSDISLTSKEFNANVFLVPPVEKLLVVKSELGVVVILSQGFSDLASNRRSLRLLEEAINILSTDVE